MVYLLWDKKVKTRKICKQINNYKLEDEEKKEERYERLMI